MPFPGGGCQLGPFSLGAPPHHLACEKHSCAHPATWACTHSPGTPGPQALCLQSRTVGFANLRFRNPDLVNCGVTPSASELVTGSPHLLALLSTSRDRVSPDAVCSQLSAQGQVASEAPGMWCGAGTSPGQLQGCRGSAQALRHLGPVLPPLRGSRFL